jgi:hypothetical protein
MGDELPVINNHSANYNAELKGYWLLKTLVKINWNPKSIESEKTLA